MILQYSFLATNDCNKCSGSLPVTTRKSQSFKDSNLIHSQRSGPGRQARTNSLPSLLLMGTVTCDVPMLAALVANEGRVVPTPSGESPHLRRPVASAGGPEAPAPRGSEAPAPEPSRAAGGSIPAPESLQGVEVPLAAPVVLLLFCFSHCAGCWQGRKKER